MIAYTLIKKSRKSKEKEFLPGSATRSTPLFKKLLFQIDFSNGYGNLLFDCNLNATRTCESRWLCRIRAWKWKVEEARLCNSSLITRNIRVCNVSFPECTLPCISCVQTENEKSHSVSTEIYLNVVSKLTSTTYLSFKRDLLRNTLLSNNINNLTHRFYYLGKELQLKAKTFSNLFSNPNLTFTRPNVHSMFEHPREKETLQWLKSKEKKKKEKM